MRGIEYIDRGMVLTKERCGSLVNRIILAAENYHPSGIAKRLLLTACGVAAASALAFGADQEELVADANGKVATPRAAPIWVVTATPTPDIPATIRAVLPTVLPLTGTPTSDIPATVRALLTAMPTSTPVIPSTPDIPATVRALLTPGLQPPQPSTPFVVKPEVVKPEVVKPEVIIITPVPGRLSQEEAEERRLEALGRRQAEIKGTATAEAIQTAEAKTATVEAKNEAKTATVEARQTATVEARVAIARGGWSFDWWSALIGGAVGLIIGGALFTRERVIDQFHPHEHPAHSHPHP